MNSVPVLYPFRRTMAIVLVLTALGVGVFWLLWFGTGMHRHPGLGNLDGTLAPPGPAYYDAPAAGEAATLEHVAFVVFENSFPAPDGVMALAMALTAVLLWQHRLAALPMLYLAAGMLWSLAALDTSYHLQHGGFVDWSAPETWSRAFISVHAAALGGLLILQAAVAQFRTWGTAPPVPRRSFRSRGVVAQVLILAATLAAHLTFLRAVDPSHGLLGSLVMQFNAAFEIAHILTFLTLGMGFVGLLRVQGSGWSWVLVAAGLALFEMIIHLAFVILNPEITESIGIGAIIPAVGLLMVLAALATSCVGLTQPHPGSAEPLQG